MYEAENFISRSKKKAAKKSSFCNSADTDCSVSEMKCLQLYCCKYNTNTRVEIMIDSLYYIGIRLICLTLVLFDFHNFESTLRNSKTACA